MRPRWSLRAAFTWWFAGILVLLYGVAATAVWLHARESDRTYALLTLKAEVEVVVAYLTSTGRLDAPEFTAPEGAPFKIWFRLVRDEQVLTQTPGTPPLPVQRGGVRKDAVMTEWSPHVKGPYLVVRHVVGGPLRGAAVEGIAPTASLRAAQLRLAASLGLIGLVVIPLAALGGRLFARRALRPIDALVARIRALDSSRLADRLALPGNAVQEVAVVAGAFDDLLGRLQASVETMRRFTADASHEIRNPLSVLRTGLEVALRRPRQPEEYRTLLQENLREMERLQAVLEGLLVLAREEPGTTYPLTRVPVDFSRLIEQTTDTFGTVAAERGIRIEEAIDPALHVAGDPQLLRLVAFNLLDNAVKYSPPGESVRVEASARAGEITLLVADHGPGVAPEDRERVFHRFFRAAPASRPGVGGLGLSVVRWVAELHGGRVGLREADRGATFEVALPAARAG